MIALAALKALRPTIGATLCATALALAACGGEGDPGATPSSAPTPTRSPSPKTPTTAATRTAPASPEPTPIATTPVLLSEDEEYERAFQAALVELDAAPSDECVSVQKTCVSKLEHAERGGRGIAVFDEHSYIGGGNILIMGRGADGEWHYWYGTQHAVTPPIYLPGDMRVCTGGPGLNVRSGPEAAATKVETLADETIVRGDEFVLTEPGDYSLTVTGGPENYKNGFGNGWYRISSPVEGWVYSPYVYYPEVSEGCEGLPLTW